MLGVKFDNLHSLEDLGLILQTVNMPMPEPKVNTVEIPGADGVLDITSYFGDVRFNNRIITMVFTDPTPYFYRYRNQTHVAENLHGRTCRIVFDEDPEYYYQGRLRVEEFAMNPTTRTITITADCEPYKYLITEGSEAWKWDPFSFVDGIIRNYGDIEIDGETPVTVVGGWKAVHPTITSDSELTVSLDDSETAYTIKPGVNKVYNITITRGDHVLHFDGHGTVSIRLQVGVF